MVKEIDISQVPLSPRGVNQDYEAVKEFDFVRIEASVSWRLSELIGPESDVSDDGQNIPPNETLNDDDIKNFLSSPMIEVRKKRSKSFGGELRFNPVNQDVIDTACGWYKNYEKSKRKTIAVIHRMSMEPPKKEVRKSLPSSITMSGPIKENIPPTNTDTEEVVDDDKRHLDLLINAVGESRPLLTSEYDRLSIAVVDWKHILENETDVPPEAQGNIQSTMGRTRILLEKRFKSTFDVLDKAERFYNNDGVIIDDSDKEYKADDVYAFVDLLINEIRNIDNEYKRLLKMRDNNWVEEEGEEVVGQIKEPVMARKKRIVMEGSGNKKQVKSKLDMKALREKYKKMVNEEQEKEEDVTEIRVEDVEKGGDKEGMRGDKEEETKRNIAVDTRRRSVRFDVTPSKKEQAHNLSVASLNESDRSMGRKTVRATGTPVHYDTPRPLRKSTRVSRLLPPQDMGSSPTELYLSAKKRSFLAQSAESDGFLLPMSQPKKARHMQ